MKASARSLISATVGLGLAAVTLVSAFTAFSVAVPATAFGLLAVYGITEMMIRSYAPRPGVARAVAPRTVATLAAAPAQVVRVRVPALVEFPGVRARVPVRAA